MKGVRVVKLKSGDVRYVVVLRNIYYGIYKTIDEAEKKCVEVNSTLSPIVKDKLNNKKYSIYVHNGCSNGNTLNKIIELRMYHKIKFDYAFYKQDCFRFQSKIYKINKKFKQDFIKNKTIIIQKTPKNIPLNTDYFIFKSILTFKSKYENKYLKEKIKQLYTEIEETIKNY